MPACIALHLLLSLCQQSGWLDSFLEGSRALEAGAYVEARAALEHSLESLPHHPPTAWQLACVCAREGRQKEAVGWLERAVEWGGADAALLEWDPDLAALRAAPGYEALRERMAAEEDPLARANPGGVLTSVGRYAVKTLSGDGRWIVWGESHRILLYDGGAQRLRAVIDDGEHEFCRASLSFDGRRLAVSTRAHASDPLATELQVFDTGSWERLLRLPAIDPWGSAQFSRDGTRLLLRNDATECVEILDPQSGRVSRSIPSGGARPYLSPDGSRLAMLATGSGSPWWSEGPARFEYWDLAEPEPLVRLEDPDLDPNATVCFAPDSQWLLVAWPPETHAFRVFAGDTGELACTLRGPAEAPLVAACLLGVRDEAALLDSRDQISILALPSGRRLRSFPAQVASAQDIRANVAGDRILVSRRFGDQLLLDADSGAKRWPARGSSGEASDVVFTPDGSRILTQHPGEGWSLVDPRSGASQVGPTAVQLPAACAVRPGHDELWVSASDASLRRLDARSGRLLEQWPAVGSAQRFLTWSPTGDLLALDTGNGDLILFDAELGRVRARIEGAWLAGTGSYRSGLVFTPDGSSCALASYHPDVRVFDARTGDLRYTLELPAGRRCFGYAPDGEHLAVARKGGRLGFFDASDGASAGPDLAVAGEIEVFAVEPSSARIWIGTDRSKVHVFDGGTHDLVRTLDLQDLDAFDTVELSAIAFSPSGELALTASSGIGVVAAWDVRTGARRWSYGYSGGNPSGLECAFSADERLAFVCGQTEWTPRVVDARNGATVLDLAGQGKWGFLPLSDSSRLALGGDEGLEVIDLSDGHQLWKRLEHAGGGWVLAAGLGYFDGTPAAIEDTHLAWSDRSLPLDCLAAALLDPKKARACAEGVACVPPRTLDVPTLRLLSPPSPAAGDAAMSLVIEARAVAAIRGFELRGAGFRRWLEGEVLADGARVLRLDERDPALQRGPVRLRAYSSNGTGSQELWLPLR